MFAVLIVIFVFSVWTNRVQFCLRPCLVFLKTPRVWERSCRATAIWSGANWSGLLSNWKTDAPLSDTRTNPLCLEDWTHYCRNSTSITEKACGQEAGGWISPSFSKCIEMTWTHASCQNSAEIFWWTHPEWKFSYFKLVTTLWPNESLFVEETIWN